MAAERTVTTEVTARDLRLLIKAVRETPGSPYTATADKVERALDTAKEAA